MGEMKRARDIITDLFDLRVGELMMVYDRSGNRIFLKRVGQDEWDNAHAIEDIRKIAADA